MLYIRWGRREARGHDGVSTCSTIGHIGGFVRTCLRIDIVSGNQLAIVSIPGDRLSEIGSRMVGAGEEEGRRSRRAGGTDRKR